MQFSRNLKTEIDIEMNTLEPNSQEQGLAEEDTRVPLMDTFEHGGEETEQGATEDILDRIEVELHREEVEVESEDEVMR